MFLVTFRWSPGERWLCQGGRKGSVGPSDRGEGRKERKGTQGNELMKSDPLQAGVQHDAMRTGGQ